MRGKMRAPASAPEIADPAGIGCCGCRGCYRELTHPSRRQIGRRIVSSVADIAAVWSQVCSKRDYSERPSLFSLDCHRLQFSLTCWRLLVRGEQIMTLFHVLSDMPTAYVFLLFF